MASSGHMVGNDREEINEIVRVLWQVSLALQLQRMDESGILPYREINHDAERQRTSQYASSRHGAAAESHQTRQPYAAQASCRARQAKLGKERPPWGERRPKSQKAVKQAKPADSARKGSKAAKVLSLLRRPDGASLKERMKATGWLAHSVRGFLSGIVAKRMRLVSAKSEVGSALCRPKAVFLWSLLSRTRGDFARAASFLSPDRAIGAVDKPSCPLRRSQLLFRVVNEDFPARSTLLAPRGNEESPQSG
jgi:Protein of unknown function (DUF3489)